MTGLSLVSTSLATPVYVTLDPADLSADAGTETIAGSSSGGTFTLAINLVADLCSAPGPNGVGCIGTPLGTSASTYTTSGTWQASRQPEL
jgi:hypothetical protein